MWSVSFKYRFRNCVTKTEDKRIDTEALDIKSV